MFSWTPIAVPRASTGWPTATLHRGGVGGREPGRRGCTPQQLLPVFGPRAEWDVIRQLVGLDGRLDGVVLTEPLHMKFAGSNTRRSHPLHLVRRAG